MGTIQDRENEIALGVLRRKLGQEKEIDQDLVARMARLRGEQDMLNRSIQESRRRGNALRDAIEVLKREAADGSA